MCIPALILFSLTKKILLRNFTKTLTISGSEFENAKDKLLCLFSALVPSPQYKQVPMRRRSFKDKSLIISNPFLWASRFSFLIFSVLFLLNSNNPRSWANLIFFSNFRLDSLGKIKSLNQ